MQSSLISKIQKANLYAREPDRVSFTELTMSFRGENDTHTVAFRDNHWSCDCHFFGGNDSLYLVDVGEDTFLFQLTGTTDVATEMEIINTIRIPYSP